MTISNNKILLKIEFIHRNIFLILSFFIFISGLSAQTKTDSLYYPGKNNVDTIPHIEVLSKYENNTVFLRWAPTDASSWYENTREGYIIYRFELDAKELPIMESKDSFIVKPWAMERFETYLDSVNENILIAAQCLYGEWEENTDFTGKNEELVNRYGYALFAADIDWKTALSLGLAFEDKNTEKDKTYFYRIVPKKKETRLKSGYTSLDTKASPEPYPLILNALEAENIITIQWSREAHQGYFSAYYIQRSSDGNIYQSLNKKPFVGGMSREFPSDVFSYSDSVDNYISYYYRLVGITPFGELSSPSKPVKAMGRDKTPPMIPKGISIDCDGIAKEVKISWKPVSSPDLANYAVYRSGKSNGEYQIVSDPLLNKNILEFKDGNIDINKFYYYKISTIDTAGNYNMSLPFIAAFRDTISPDSPTGLAGSIDSLGKVTLTWNKNNENDVAGYHVYMSNSPFHKFVKITHRTLSDNFWTDTITLKTFTENIYYKITAIDFHGHFSEFSKTLKLKKPDIIPPFPPSIKNYVYDDKSNMIILEWSPSKSSDIDHHELYKKYGAKWQRIMDFDENNHIIKDKEVSPGKNYRYKILAVDDDGLYSNGKAFAVVKTIDKRLPETPEILTCKYEGDNKILLEWKPVNDTKHQNYIIYRSADNSPFTVLARTKDTFYSDDDISLRKKYAYKIKQAWKDGKKSRISKEVTVE